MQRPYAQYSEAVMAPPAGAEVVDDWEIFYEIARRLDVALTLDSVQLDMQRKPTTEDLLRILMRRSSVPFEELRAATRGKVFAVEAQTVLEPDTDHGGRLHVAPPDVVLELAEARAEAQGNPPGFPLRLAVRRLRDVQNTMYHSLPGIRRRVRINHAHAHPESLADAGLEDGAMAEIASPYGSIELPVRADADLRPGVVSIPHGWGDLIDGDASAVADRAPGANVNRLTSAVEGSEPINAMPRLTGLPLRLRALTARNNSQEIFR